VLALKSGASPDGRRKRVPIASPYRFDWKTAIENLALQRPDLKDRLADASKAPTRTRLGAPDFKRLEAVVGMKETEFVKSQDTVQLRPKVRHPVTPTLEPKQFAVTVPAPRRP
jgi:hypothetical protein